MKLRRPHFILALLGTLLLFAAPALALNATWNAATDVPVTGASFTASGTVNFTLNFAPPPGTNLTVVNNTGLGFINGAFSNLAQGQAVALTYNGVTYHFVANYYGGTGNDLVLVWQGTRAFAWGNNTSGQLGDNTTAQRQLPVPVNAAGVLAGKTLVSVATGGNHSVALCSDGTVAAWGYNSFGQLGDNSTTNRQVPVAVNTAAGVSALFGKTVVAVAAGFDHSVALCSDGTVAAWGYNATGQLGDNTTTQRTAPVSANTASGVSALSGKTVVGIAAGGFYSLALCSDGTVAGWGQNTTGQLGDNSTSNHQAPVAVNTASGVSALFGKTVVSVAAGSEHSLARCSDGTVAAWGFNGAGELGDNSTTNRQAPVAVNTASGVSALFGKPVVAVAAGEEHSVALCSDGTVAAWGYNGYGQLGDNSTTNRQAPVAVNTASGISALFGKTVVAVAVDYSHSVARCADGTVSAWGGNADGQLGDNSTTQRNAPVAVNSTPLAAGERFTGLFNGSMGLHTVTLVAGPPPAVTTLAATAVTASGAVLNGTMNANNNNTAVSFDYGTSTAYGTNVAGTPTPVTGTTDTAVSVALADLSPGTTYHYRVNGASGYGTTNGSDLTFTTPGNVSAVYNAATDVPVSTNNFTATGGTLNLTLNFAPTPGMNLTVVNNTGLGFITGAFSNLAQGQTVALAYNGVTYDFVANYYGGTGNDLVLVWQGTRAFAWGDNGTGELGDNTTTQRNLPTPVTATGVLAGKTVVSVAAGAHHSVALCSDGTVAAWGYNFYGQLGDNTMTDRHVPVAVNTASGVSALFGKTVVAVAAGEQHSVALCSDGTVAAWGYNGYGQLGDNSTTNRPAPVAVNTASGVSALFGKAVVGMAAGGFHSLALCADGTVAAWGYNFYGQLGDSSTTNRQAPMAVNTASGVSVLFGETVVAVSAGESHSLALCADGTVAAWGYNTVGQLGDNSANDRHVPVAVNTASGVSALFGKTVVAVSGGADHSVALCSDGTVATWGNNVTGQLGDNSTTQRNAPVVVNTASGVSALFGKTVVAVAGGGDQSVALSADGTGCAWGSNASGQLGDNTTTERNAPVAVNSTPLAAGERFVGLCKGSVGDYTLALVAGPPPAVTTLAATGVTSSGATLNGTVNANNNSAAVSFDYGTSTAYGTNVSGTPTPVTGTAATAVSVALTGLSPGTTYHYRVNGVSDYGTTNGSDLTFTTPGNMSAVYSAATDVPVTAASYTASGTVNFTLNFAPTPGTNLTVVNNTGLGFINGAFSNLAQGQAVALTYNGVVYHFVANYYGGTGNDLVLVSQGTRAFAWGDNNNGQLGDNSTTQRNLPVPVSATGVLAGKTVVSVAAGAYHSVALCSDGTVAAWGYNFYGQLGDNTTTDRQVPVAVNTASGISALFGKTVVAVAAGLYHSVALCADGTVAAWGDNSYGKLGDNSTTQRNVPVAVNTASGVSMLFGKTVVAVAAGSEHTVALCSDGTVAAWGYNGQGQLGDNSTTNRQVPVAVNMASGISALYGKIVMAVKAGYHSVALCTDGTMAAWGYNAQGELGDNTTTTRQAPVAVNTVSGVSALFGKTVVSIEAGVYQSVALCADGTIAAWGDNSNGQLGDNSTTNRQVPVVVNTTSGISALFGKSVTSIAAGSAYTVALSADGTVAAWGDNGVGELGDNTTTNRQAPVAVNSTPIAAGERFTGLFKGSTSFHTFALVAGPPPAVTTLAATAVTGNGATLNGTVNANNNSTAVSFDYGTSTAYGTNVAGTPKPVTGTTDTAVSVALTGLSPGTAYHYRVNGASGYGTTNGSDLTFTTPGNMSAVYSAATDVPVTAASYTASGTVNFTLNFAPTPGTNLTVVNNTGLGFINGAFSNLAQGQTVALTYNGVTYNFVANYYGGTGNDLVLVWQGTRAFAWGYNSTGELGDNSTTQRNLPVPVTATGVLAGKTVVAVATGAYHSVALCTDGTVAAWGYNFYGQLGDNTTTDRQVPVAVNTASGISALFGKTVVAIAAGEEHSLALCSDGTVAAWGYNGDGRLGDNSTTQRNVPVAVNTASGVSALFGKTVVAVAAGDSHSLALCADGTVAAWGYNGDGELGDNSTTGRQAPVAVTTASGVSALFGKTVVAVAAGYEHSVVLCSDGTVAAWGYNGDGQLGDNSTTSRQAPVAVNTASGVSALFGKTAVAVAAGVYHSVALCADGTVAAWGYNFYGQLGDNSTTQRNVPVAVNTASGVSALFGKTVVAVAAGGYHSLALCSDGTAAAWGWNVNGQLGDNSTTNRQAPVAVNSTPFAAGERFTGLFKNSVGEQTLALVAGRPPGVSTLATTALTSTGATLNGTVNANDNSTAVSFDYGTSTAYGTNVAGAPTPLTSTTDTAVSVALTGLSPGTTYHYRVNGASGYGTTNGPDLAFTTLTPSENWRLTYFGTSANTGSAADSADPNGNGIKNLLEYALGGDPAGNTTARGILPQVAKSTGNTLQISFTRYLDRTDLTLTVYAADSLAGPWTALAHSTAGGSFTVLASGATAPESGTGNTRIVTVTDLYRMTDPAHPQRFMKLEVTR